MAWHMINVDWKNDKDMVITIAFIIAFFAINIYWQLT